MSGHPLLSRMREAGMLNTAGGGANSVEVELPSVHAHLQLDPDDSVSQTMASSPRPSGRSPKQSTRSSPRRLRRTTSVDKLSAPDSTVSATQRNVKLKSVDEESVGQKGWNKLRKAVKTKKKGKKKVPIYDLVPLLPPAKPSRGSGPPSSVLLALTQRVAFCRPVLRTIGWASATR